MADSKEDEYFQAKYIYLVDIEIIRGINLAKADTFGKSDGFVKVQCLNRKFKTDVIKNDLNPTWNAKTQFQFYQEPADVLFRVLDWNQSGLTTKLGNYTVSLKGFFKPGAKDYCEVVELKDIQRGEIEIKISCKKLDPFELLKKFAALDTKCKDNKEQIAKCEQQCENAIKKCRELEQEVPVCKSDCDDAREKCDNERQRARKCHRDGQDYDDAIVELDNECKKLEQRKKQLKTEYKRLDEELSKYSSKYQKAQERQHQYTDSKGQKDLNKVVIMNKIDVYMEQIGKDDEDDDIEYDQTISYEIIHKYAGKRKEAKKYQATAMKYSDQEDKTEECEEENRKYQKAIDQATKYLRDIKRWNQQTNEELYKKQQKCVDGYEYDDTNYKEFFRKFYMALCKFFFNTQIIAATLEEFGDEIKKDLKRSYKKITLTDLIGIGADNDDDDYEDSGYESKKSQSIWKAIYTDLDFVMDEMNALCSDAVKKKPIYNLCKNATEFIKEYYCGNYPRFANYLSHYICMIIVDPDDPIVANPNHLTDDALGAIVLLFTDKKNFPLKLFKTIPKSSSSSGGGYDDSDDEYGGGGGTSGCVQDAFEKTLAAVVVAICKLDAYAGKDVILNQEDMKKINEQKKWVLCRASEYQLDAKSVKVIEIFFAYFFKPEGSACCDCGGDEGGFFGSLFGWMCK